MLIKSLLCLAVFAAPLICFNKSVFAEPFSEDPFFSKPCDEFDSAQNFVGRASAYCIKHSLSRYCDEMASLYFYHCGFNGDFFEMQRRTLTQTLMILLISSTGQAVPNRSGEEL